MKILVTGGAGFIGSHLVDTLATNPRDKIIVFDNFRRGSLKNLSHSSKKSNVRITKGDVRNYPDLEKIGKVDVVYHLAAQSNVIGSAKNPDYSFSTNVDGAYNVLKYASESGVKKLVFSSSREVYGNPKYIPVDEKHPLSPINMYGSTKASGEMLCKAFEKIHGLNIVIVRMANVYGRRDSERVIPLFLDWASKDKNLIVYGGKQILDFVHVKDMVDSIIDVSSKKKFLGKTINIGTGKGTSINSLARIIIKMTNSKSKVIRKNPRGFDVKRFVARSYLYRKKYVELKEGLEEMIK